MIGFIDTSYVPLLSRGYYSVIVNFRTLQFTIIHTLGFPVFTSRILATDLNAIVILVSHMKSSCLFWKLFTSEDSTQFTSWQAGVSKLNSILWVWVWVWDWVWVWVLCYDRRSVGQFVLEYSTHLELTTGYLLVFDNYGPVFVGVLSDERTGLTFVYVAGTRQRSLSCVRVPLYS
jgi:hypothetical protein